MAEEKLLLDRFATASAHLSRVADPFGPPGPKRVKEMPGLPVPHSQEGQLALLWIASYDAFEVTRILEHRAAPSVLAQLRYLSEALGLILWLVETNDEKEMRSRSLSFAQAEVRDFGSVHSEWKERPQARRQYIADVIQIKHMAEAEGVKLIGRPGRKILADKSGVGRSAYNLMSDIGSHAGLNSPMVFFGIPGENRFVIHPQAGVLPRAYFLGLGFELYAVCASNVLGALGFVTQRNDVDSLVEKERGYLARSRHLMDTRED